MTPNQVQQLIQEQGLAFAVQGSEIRTFPDKEYELVGAEVREDISDCGLVLGVKEMPSVFFREKGTYAFFAHVAKGQKYNMPMLARMMELGCNLIDYEKIADQTGRRLVFFGRFAGIAGMTNTLVALGRRLEHEGIQTPILGVKPAHEYGRIDALMAGVSRVGQEIKKGFAAELVPLVIGVAGYGNVAKGAFEVLDALGATDVPADQLAGLATQGDTRTCYRTVFKEEQMVEPNEPGRSFNLQEYYREPGRYRPIFEKHLPHLTALVNCIYWDKQYPRLVTKEWLRNAFRDTNRPRLRVIGDISCDIEGSIEATVKATDSGSPFFVYEPDKGSVTEGTEGKGVIIMAVDNLPCELPADASEQFGNALMPFIPAMARADFEQEFDRLELPPAIRRALILHKGKLTSDYRHIARFLDGASRQVQRIA